MNLIFDVDDTMYDLMWPFQKAFEKVLADKTDVGCEAFFSRSRECSVLYALFPRAVWRGRQKQRSDSK